ncbi:MAG: hypothetical protein ABJA82_02750, partial [Myxococcales bacterium]
MTSRLHEKASPDRAFAATREDGKRFGPLGDLEERCGQFASKRSDASERFARHQRFRATISAVAPGATTSFITKREREP